jgi:hypothetical protein
MNLRKKIAVLVAAVAISGGLLATFLSPQTPVAKAGLWCGQSCTNFVVPTPLPTE